MTKINRLTIIFTVIFTIIFSAAIFLSTFSAAHASSGARSKRISAASQARKEIVSDILNFRAALDREDFDAAMSLYTPDFVMVMPNGQILGREGLRQGLEEFRNQVHEKAPALCITYFHYTPKQVVEINTSHILGREFNSATQRQQRHAKTTAPRKDMKRRI